MIEQILKVLVDAGYTPSSAAVAAVILDGNGTVQEAAKVLEWAPEPVAVFDAELLLAQVRRERALVEARHRS